MMLMHETFIIPSKKLMKSNLAFVERDNCANLKSWYILIYGI